MVGHFFSRVSNILDEVKASGNLDLVQLTVPVEVALNDLSKFLKTAVSKLKFLQMFWFSWSVLSVYIE